jgi:ubiquinol-cytochrome c reductase cytochrome c subunit
MRKRLVLPLLVAGLVLPSLAAAGVPPPYGIVYANAPATTPLRELGYQLYAGNCSTCHGPRGEGITEAKAGRGSGGILGLGPPLTAVGELSPDFYLRTGRMPLGKAGDEPARSHVFFSDREIRALVAYVGTLGHGPSIPTPHPERGRLPEGLQLFTQHCAGCHQVAAAGGYLTGGVAPSLKDATPTEIAEAVRIGPFVMPRFSRQAITDRQLDSIVAYVQYAKHPKNSGGWSLGNVGPITEGLVTWLIAGAALVAMCMLIGTRLRQ